MDFEEKSESSMRIRVDSNWKLKKPQIGISPYERSNHTCVNVKFGDEENLFVYGGHDENGNDLNDLLIYNKKLGWSYASANKIVSTINKVIVVEEGFSYHPQSPLELSAIPQGRSFHTSVVYHNFMIVFGGNATEIDGQTYFLDFSPNARLTWNVFTSPYAPPEVKTQRFQHTAVVWNNQMVIFGGTNGETALPASILFLDLVKFKWKVRNPPNLKPTYGHAAFVRNNLMYIVGGSNPVLSNGFSIYSLDTDQVLMNGSDFLPMDINVDRRLLTATVVNNFLYLIGGYSVTSDDVEMGCANQVDVIDLETKKWISLYPDGSNPEAICGHTAVKFKRKLAVFGGCDRLPLLDGRWVFYGFTGNMWKFRLLSEFEFDRIRREEFEKLIQDEFDRVRNDEFDKLTQEEVKRINRDEFDKILQDEFDKIKKEEFDRLTQEEFDRLTQDEFDRIRRDEFELLKIRFNRIKKERFGKQKKDGRFE